MSLRKEIQDVVDEITGKAHEGEPVWQRLAHAAVELTEVSGLLYQAVDAENRDADLKSLCTELEEGASKIVEQLLADRAIVKRGIKAAIPFVVPEIVEAIADNAVPVTVFIETKVLPMLAEMEEAVHRTRVAFGE